jgi:hypothetical protein
LVYSVEKSPQSLAESRIFQQRHYICFLTRYFFVMENCPVQDRIVRRIPVVLFCFVLQNTWTGQLIKNRNLFPHSSRIWKGRDQGAGPSFTLLPVSPFSRLTGTLRHGNEEPGAKNKLCINRQLEVFLSLLGYSSWPCSYPCTMICLEIWIITPCANISRKTSGKTHPWTKRRPC